MTTETAEPAQARCAVCHEPIASDDGIHWTHTHGDIYCGTGDGATAYPQTTCRHCGRRIIFEGGSWIDPEATGDDSVWRETCDAHDTFVADHEPDEGRTT